MSRQLTPLQLALLSAALRHVRDAEYLLAAPEPDGSPDEAWYLAGYGPECVRKAGLDQRSFDHAIGHGLADASRTAVAFALAHDPRPRRYGLHRFHLMHPTLERDWKVEQRYDATGTRAPEDVRKAVAEARQSVDDTLFALWADGRIPGAFSW